MATYTCFTRNWYRYEHTSTGTKKIVPAPGARRTIVMTFTGKEAEAEARAFCKKWNEEHKPGPLSRKCEYTFNY